MTDEKLRALERRWRESGSVQDEAAWLQERVRQGALSREMLELAAYCGHGASRHILCHKFEVVFDEEWPAGLSSWGTRVIFRAIALMLLVDELADEKTTPEKAFANALLSIAVRWIANPCDQHLVEARNLYHACSPNVREGHYGYFKQVFELPYLLWGEHSKLIPFYPDDEEDETYFDDLLPNWREIHIESLEKMCIEVVKAVAPDARRSSTEIRYQEQVRRALASEMITWALGYGDPLLDRANKLGIIV